MRQFISLVGALALLSQTGLSMAEPVRYQCSGKFQYADGEGEGFDGSYTWSIYVNLDEASGMLVSAPMFPKPVPMEVTPQLFSAQVQGDWCFKPYGPSDHQNFCGTGTRTLKIDRRSGALTLSYTPQNTGGALGALQQGRCQIKPQGGGAP